MPSMIEFLLTAAIAGAFLVSLVGTAITVNALSSRPPFS